MGYEYVERVFMLAAPFFDESPNCQTKKSTAFLQLLLQLLQIFFGRSPNARGCVVGVGLLGLHGRPANP